MQLHDVILHKIMEFLCSKHEHSWMALKIMSRPFKYLKYYWICINIIHINHVTQNFDQQQTQGIDLFEIACQSKSLHGSCHRKMEQVVIGSIGQNTF
jgi:hypothetical protein